VLRLDVFGAWIVRRITLVRTSGLAAIDADFWLPALSARPVRPPRPTIVAAAATRVFMFFTTAYLLAGFALGSLGRRC